MASVVVEISARHHHPLCDVLGISTDVLPPLFLLAAIRLQIGDNSPLQNTTTPPNQHQYLHACDINMHVIIVARNLPPNTRYFGTALQWVTKFMI